ncbi:MAG: FHA domain-containing protein [Myxococcales bacterium]|nr:FHA domain-containing protein [Myxococcales bacterium]
MTIGRGERRAFHTETSAHLALPDPWLSTAHAELRTSFGRILLCDTNSKNGCRINGQRVQRQELFDGDLIELGRSFFIFRSHVPTGEDTPAFVDLENVDPEQHPLTLSPDLAVEVAKLSMLAATDISILLLGETGTGKEVLATYIHETSERPGQFVPVNCGALPAGLVESELFGHTKGSFSGATRDHEGLIRSADQGSLFLDEIADLPTAAQATMLRVLQDSQVRPVGSTESQAVHLRSICATHRDLDGMVERGEFRSDLFARIAGYRMTLPPLRNRREDFGLLIKSFLADTKSESALSIEAARALFSHSWPLNIRELRSCIATATVLAAGARIDLSHLPEALRSQDKPASTTPTPGQAGGGENEADLIRLLEVYSGNVSAVARSMGKDRKQIQRWMKRYAIDPNQFRGD